MKSDPFTQKFGHALCWSSTSCAEQILTTINASLSAKGLLLRSGTVGDATLISVPISTKNASGARDPEMKQSQQGLQWFFEIKALQGLPAKSMVVAC